MSTTFLLLGGNELNSFNVFKTAKELIILHVGNICLQSSIYKTEPWGNKNQPYYINQAIAVNTSLNPEDLLKKTLSIENELGRKREVKWGQRLIDIDILFYNDFIIKHADLTIPHKYIQQRLFALIPLYEIAPQLMHPVLKLNITQLVALCEDKLQVEKLDRT